MPTTAGGIWYPGAGDPVTPLQSLFSTMASSVDAKLGVPLYATEDAANTAFAVKPFQFYVQGASYNTGTLYSRRGNVWHPLWDSDQFAISSARLLPTRTGWTINANAYSYGPLIIVSGSVKKNSGTIGIEGIPALPAGVSISATGFGGTAALLTYVCAQRNNATLVQPATISINPADNSMAASGGGVGNTIHLDNVIFRGTMT